jgi:hypothetical protein
MKKKQPNFTYTAYTADTVRIHRCFTQHVINATRRERRLCRNTASRVHVPFQYSRIASIDSRQMILRRGVRVITISCMNNASTLPNLPTHLRGIPPLPRPRSARCAVPGGAFGPALGYIRSQSNKLSKNITA